MKVMVIEDEKEMRDHLETSLSDEFEVVLLDSGNNLQAHLTVHKPDVLLLDQMLPGKSGADIVREVRANPEYSKMPIIMVTGLTSEDDKVAALELGADDYVTKPAYPRELAARIKAVHRRVSEEEYQKKLVSGGLEIDFAAHRVLLGGREVPLTLTEFKILSELMKRSGQVLSREKLRERALGNLNVTDRTIDVHMASLRKKLSEFGANIETVRGVGYRFYHTESQAANT